MSRDDIIRLIKTEISSRMLFADILVTLDENDINRIARNLADRILAEARNGNLG